MNPHSEHTLSRPTACFSVVARAEPGVLPRVIELFAKRGLVPTRCHARVGARPGRNEPEELTIDIQMAGMEAELAEYVAACLRQVYEVDCVLTSEKRDVAEKRGTGVA